jgi:hypothetical protein
MSTVLFLTPVILFATLFTSGLDWQHYPSDGAGSFRQAKDSVHKVVNCARGYMLVELTKDELSIINNALNEVCNGIDLEREFDTRMGCTVEEARAVLAKTHGLVASQ